MGTLGELLKQRKYEQLWERCCGFIDLSIEDFMKIQRRLLVEQLELLKKCELGRYILNGTDPSTVEEFREQVPLTTYADYAPYLLERRSDVLPAEPIMWAHTSGRSGEYPFKWVPISSKMYDEMKEVAFAMLIFGSCRKRGDIVLREHEKAVYALPPMPYASGIIGHMINDEGIIDFLPATGEAETLEFADRVQLGFELALSQGFSLFGGLSSVLVSIAERLGKGDRNIRPVLSNPKALVRLVKGLVKSKLAFRQLLPKDVWTLKALLAGGTDTQVYKEKIKEMWGRYPLDVYGSTEASTMAIQAWDYQGMTFLPQLHFFEFIPEEEGIKSRKDPAYQPRTLLLDEVKAGQKYEIVVSNFHGGAMIRYKIGDLITITSLRNEELNIDIPQMAFSSRVDDLIDIAGFARLTEKVIWQAIENSGITYSDWTVRKEIKEKPVLHLYIELKRDGHLTCSQVYNLINEQLKKLDSNYADLETFADLRPLEITLLPANSFEAYSLKQQAAGADLAHLKIPHVNPSDNMLNFLMNGSSQAVVTSSEGSQVEPVQSG